MELQFQKSVCRCLRAAVREVQNREQTQEIRLTDGMPDVGRVVGAWGQAITRGKEWRTDAVSVSGGCMVWVLYVPEDGSEPRMLDTWIPFQMKWELPGALPEGDIRVGCRLRFVDARSISPRKILARVGVAVLAEAFVPMEAEIPISGEVPQDVQLLQRTYPVRLPKEAGEKLFSLEESLNLPGSAPRIKKLLCYSLRPQITDRKIMTGRMVFRGNGNLHLLYQGEDGQLYAWDFELPFSQLAELKGEFGGDAQGDITLCVTNLELDMGEDGALNLKCSMVAQYLVDDRETLTMVEDAYSTNRPLEMHTGELELPMMLDSSNVNIYGEQTIPGNANMVVDTQFLPDYPRMIRSEQGMEAELSGQYQMLYYDENGQLQSASARWEDTAQIPAGGDSRVYGDLTLMGESSATPGSENVVLRSDMQLNQRTVGAGSMPMVTGLNLGEAGEPDPARPSLILRRAGDWGLWELAKMSGSTMDAIREANGLTEEPVSGQMLLIPVS